jgi:hypothetical protein
VLTFNTLDGSADVTELAEVIRTARPDLAALIEVGQTYRARLAPLVEPLGYRMVTATGTDIDGVTDVYGVTALVAEHLRGATSNIDMSTPFPIVEIEGGDLGATRFVAFHAVAPRGGDVPQWSSDLGKLTRYCTGGTPAIVAGDINATLDHSVLRAATAGCSDAAAQRGQGLRPPGRPGCLTGSARRSTRSSSRTRSPPRTSRSARYPGATTARCWSDSTSRTESARHERCAAVRRDAPDARAVVVGVGIGCAETALRCSSGWPVSAPNQAEESPTAGPGKDACPNAPTSCQRNHGWGSGGRSPAGRGLGVAPPEDTKSEVWFARSANTPRPLDRAPPGTRTPNPLVKSQLLCQLS